MTKTGDEESQIILTERLLEYGRRICRVILITVNLKYFDFSEAEGVISTSAVTTLLKYNGKCPVRAYFRKVLVRNFYRLLNEYFLEQQTKSNKQLDESTIDGEGCLVHELVGTSEEDPRLTYELRELKFRLCEGAESRNRGDSLQSKALILRMEGYTLTETARLLKVSMSKLRRILSDDKEGTPLSELKIKLK